MAPISCLNQTCSILYYKFMLLIFLPTHYMQTHEMLPLKACLPALFFSDRAVAKSQKAGVCSHE